VITKQLTRNAAGDPVLSLRVTGADDVYRFAHGMQTLQVEFARKGTLALTGLRRMVGKANYGWLVDTFHGSGRHSEIDRRGAYERGYADATADKAECVALALHSTFDAEKIGDLIPQTVWDDLLERGLVHMGREPFTEEGFTATTSVGTALLIAALASPERTRQVEAA
jgi:hypothetical protein